MDHITHSSREIDTALGTSDRAGRIEPSSMIFLFKKTKNVINLFKKKIEKGNKTKNQKIRDNLKLKN